MCRVLILDFGLPLCDFQKSRELSDPFAAAAAAAAAAATVGAVAAVAAGVAAAATVAAVAAVAAAVGRPAPSRARKPWRRRSRTLPKTRMRPLRHTAPSPTGTSQLSPIALNLRLIPPVCIRRCEQHVQISGQTREAGMLPAA